MADEPEEEEDDEEDESEEEEEMFDEEALTSFRMFHQRINDEEVEDEPEEEWESVDENEDEDQDEEIPNVPNAAYVAQKLTQRGITMEDLVKNILFQEHSNWGTLYTENERKSSEVYGQFRAIISQYQPSSETTVAPVSVPTPTPVTQSVLEIDSSAQPKTTHVRRIPTFMIHV
jgi:hypothetical protein